jgi:outer membrane protein TolC
MSRLNRLPKVNAFLDLGTQSEGWRYNDDSRYYLVGVQLSLPIFQGFRNDRTIRQNQLELQKSEQDLVHTQKRLELGVSVARNELATTIENYHAAEEQLSSAQSYFHLVDRGYKEGVNSLIEFLDARNELTSSQLQLNLRKLEALTASAHLERETASYTISN